MIPPFESIIAQTSFLSIRPLKNQTVPIVRVIHDMFHIFVHVIMMEKSHE